MARLAHAIALPFLILAALLALAAALIAVPIVTALPEAKDA